MTEEDETYCIFDLCPRKFLKHNLCIYLNTKPNDYYLLDRLGKGTKSKTEYRQFASVRKPHEPYNPKQVVPDITLSILAFNKVIQVHNYKEIIAEDSFVRGLDWKSVYAYFIDCRHHKEGELAGVEFVEIIWQVTLHKSRVREYVLEYFFLRHWCPDFEVFKIVKQPDSGKLYILHKTDTLERIAIESVEEAWKIEKTKKRFEHNKEKFNTITRKEIGRVFRVDGVLTGIILSQDKVEQYLSKIWIKGYTKYGNFPFSLTRKTYPEVQLYSLCDGNWNLIRESLIPEKFILLQQYILSCISIVNLSWKIADWGCEQEKDSELIFET